MNKIYIFFIVALTFNLSTAQVAIGKTSVEGSSTLLDFGTENKGIVLPWLTETPSDNVGGTLIFDASSSTEFKVKYFDGTQWIDLSRESGSADLSTQSPSEVGDGVLISNDSSVARGNAVLALESENMAMRLPQVESPESNIKSPVAGTMVYDPVKKVIAVFNGSTWSFWGQDLSD